MGLRSHTGVRTGLRTGVRTGLRTGLRYTAAAATLGVLMASGASAGVAAGNAPSARPADEHPHRAGGDSPLYLELPPPAPPEIGDPAGETAGGPSGTPGGHWPPADGLPQRYGIPATVLAAYQRAAARLDLEQPLCGVPVPLLAAIGRVESNHARGGRLDHTGRASVPIIGPQLNGGSGVATIYDTDDGRLDGDPVYDRAVGPMQFIPSTWARWGADGNGDGVPDPQSIFDSTLAAARYLCAAGGDLTVASGLHRAIRAYNRPDRYLRAVLSWMRFYSAGTVPVPDSAPAARDEQQSPRGGRSAPEASPRSEGTSPEPEERTTEQPAGDPANRDHEEQPDPVRKVDEPVEPVEPVEELADELLDGAPVDPPPLPG